MDITRLKRTSNDVPHVAVFLERPQGTHLHTGIVYRDVSGKAKQLDLAWHKKLRVLDCPPVIGCAVPGFDPTDEQFIALYCGKIARSFPVRKLPYNLKIDNEVRFNAGGGQGNRILSGVLNNG